MKRGRPVSRRSERGFTHVSFVLEASAVLGWFAVLVLGERLVGDATTARRAVEVAAQQSSVVLSTSYCEGEAEPATTLAGYRPDANAGVEGRGAPDVGAVLSLARVLGIGSQPTFRVYTSEAQTASARATQGGIRGAKQVGDAAHTFEGQRSLACRERSADTPSTSIAKYRASIFDTNIKGF